MLTVLEYKVALEVECSGAQGCESYITPQNISLCFTKYFSKCQMAPCTFNQVKPFLANAN